MMTQICTYATRRFVFALAAGTLLWGGVAHGQVAYDSIQLPGLVVTGVRADSLTTVVITASYNSGGTTQSGLYQGTLQGALKAPVSKWTILQPVIPNQTVTSSTLYGPNTAFFNPSLGYGKIRAVGSYKYTTGASGPDFDHGCMYEGAIGSGRWTQLDATSLVPAGDTLLNTICHSTMGDLVVGNYDTELVAGNAFIYNVKSNKWVNLNPTGSKSTTAYGIWQNGGSQSCSYTIAGGFSDLNSGGLDVGYIVDYDSVTGKLTNLKKLNYNNQPVSSLISHFDGITGTPTGYNLTGDYVNIQPTSNGGSSAASVPVSEAGFFASIKRKPNGSFGEATWREISFTSRDGTIAETTSGNTVVGNNVLGIYVDGTESSYVATVYDNTPVGWLYWKLWDIYSVLSYWLVSFIYILSPV